MTGKHPLASVTNWAGFASVLNGVLIGAGVTVDVQTFSEIATAAVSLIIGAVTLYGRARASQPIQWRKD